MTARARGDWIHCIHSQEAEGEEEIGLGSKTSRPSPVIHLPRHGESYKLAKPLCCLQVRVFHLGGSSYTVGKREGRREMGRERGGKRGREGGGERERRRKERRRGRGRGEGNVQIACSKETLETGEPTE